MASFLESCLWAAVVLCTFFGAIDIQKHFTADLERRADQKEFKGWCNVDMKSNSKATIDCRRISRLEY